VNKSEDRLMRRVQGYHDIRMDGMLDLVIRAKGARVMDIGCNRGLVAFEFANNGAKLVHGCDNYQEGIGVARHLFCDLRNVESRFESVDLTKGVDSLKPFAGQEYDITVMLATYHKIKRLMPAPKLSELMIHIGRQTRQYFGWRGTSEDASGNEGEILQLEKDMKAAGLKLIHRSYISQQLGVAAIWGRL
jgi:SAM-dependent methyltransferase